MKWYKRFPIAAECPECGRIKTVDEDGLCHCGNTVSFIYTGLREWMGEVITRATWWRIKRDYREGLL